MENGHVVAAATFRKEWDEKAVLDFLKSLFPSKLGAFDDVEVVMSVHCRLLPPILAPGQALSGFLLQKVFKDKPVYVRPMREILPMQPSFKKAKHDSEVRTAEREFILCSIAPCTAHSRELFLFCVPCMTSLL